MRRPLPLIAACVLLLGASPGCGKKAHPVAPPEASYGTLSVGSVPSGAAIRIDGADMDATTPEDFTLASGRHRVEVALGGHAFTPHETTLAVPGDGDVAFSFVEYAARLAPSAPSHAFDPQALGTTSSAWCLTVTNTGNAVADSGAFAVSGPDAGAFAIASGASWRDLAPGASQPLCVTFRPGHTGANSASIHVGDVSVTLTGRGDAVPCALRPSETAHDFGSQAPGQSYPDWCFTVTNDDAATCTDTLRLTGAGAGQFAITSGAAIALAPGASQSVCVAFRPTVGGTLTATIGVGATSVTLSANSTGGCAIGTPTTPDGTDFGLVCVDANVASKRVVVPNSGNLPCTVTASTTYPRFTVTPASQTVPANGAATFQVTYRPASAETAQCDVRLASGASEWLVPFTGRGASVPAADFAPGTSVLHMGTAIPFVPTVVTNGPPITSWSWDFGDGGTDTSPQPSHSYAAGGMYNVSLTLQSACGRSATITHTLCIEERAYLYLWRMDETVTPSLTTNIAGWGSSVPIVLYRGRNAAFERVPLESICQYVGELLRARQDDVYPDSARGGAETIGLAGQSFDLAKLPIPSSVCGVKVDLSLASPCWNGTEPRHCRLDPNANSPGAVAYVRSGACPAHSRLGTIQGAEACSNYTANLHCGLPGLDNRIEWGLEPQLIPRWVVVASVRITWDCWWVCPNFGPQTHPLRVVNAEP